ncbi:MAG: LytTR family DNA-binding domain-containing protein, partial [Bacteroidota bacterium]
AVDDSIIPIEPLFLGFFIEIAVFTYAMIIILLNIIREKQTLSQENQQLHETMSELISTTNEQTKEFIKLKSKAVLDTERIKYIQSDDHYLEFHVTEKERPEIDRNNLSTVIKVLPPHFIQIHRSTIVNLDFVQSINNTNVTLNDGTELNVSRTYKAKVEDYLKGNQ